MKWLSVRSADNWDEDAERTVGGMLKGTEVGTWIPLPVRQKQPLSAKGTGGIGD